MTEFINKEKITLIEEQIIIIKSILDDVVSNQKNFNELKKQITKYIKQNKSENFILNYIVSSKYMFYDDKVNSLKNLYLLIENKEIDDEEKIYYIKEYIKSFISICWYIANKIDYTHTYQIKMLYPYCGNMEEAKKTYHKILKLNRTCGRNYKTYIPFLLIYSYVDEALLELLFLDKEEINKSKYIFPINSILVEELKTFLDYYITASSYTHISKNRIKAHMISYHPFYRMLNDAFNIFLSQNKYSSYKVI
ncbi:hypothetical protein [Aliarcobacter butzleri]|uniref:hypothetical protein n=1 Tax=Aliarcobacter butzleri TaxID=28197 RepID=UPI002B2540E2|nr:hypothetical protein [Aliarcobacter butzleri]